MGKSLVKEIKDLLDLVESFKSEISKVSVQKEGFKAVSQHIEKAISESEEAAKKIIELINSSLSTINELREIIETVPEEKKKLFEEKEKELMNNLTEALTLLEFQDILAQRLIKVKNFLSDIEKSLVKIALLAGLEEVENSEKEEIEKKLEELEWKKEVTQDDVDEIMKQFGL